MKLRTLVAAAPALVGALFLSGCFYSHTTEQVPAPAYPPATAAPASCVFAGQAYATGARMVTPEARTIECGRDGYWHQLN
jgi:hypothetical protein